MVAGVRGTSVSVTRAPATGNYTMTIIDSTRPGSDAASISNQNPGADPAPISVSSGTLLTYTSGSLTPLIPVHKTKTEFFSNTDPWIRTNTLADIDLMTERISDANPPTRIVDELTVTIPTDTTILNQLTNTALVAGDTDDLAIVTNIATSPVADTAYEHLKNKGKQIGCKRK